MSFSLANQNKSKRYFYLKVIFVYLFIYWLNFDGLSHFSLFRFREVRSYTGLLLWYSASLHENLLKSFLANVWNGWLIFFAISNQILCHSKEAHKFALQLVFSLNVSMTGEIHFQTGRAILYQWNFHESQAILVVNEMY